MFARPTFTEIINRVLADFSSRIVGTDGAVLRRSVLGALGRALAGCSHELHGRLDYLARQITVDTADAEYLERWASVWAIKRKPAAYAFGSLTFTGTNGSVIAPGSIVRRQDGQTFEVTTFGNVSGGTANVGAKAQAAGALGNTSAGVALSLLSPISGVQSSALVAVGGLVNGSDTETDEQLRTRVLARIREPPQGGAAWDYEAWALANAGVTRVWVSPREMGPGTVTVRFTRDNDVSIIPDAGEVEVVRQYIEARRPVTADVYVVAPVAMPINMTIQLAPNTTAVQQAVAAELADMIRREGEPTGMILASHIREAISTAAGEFDHRLIIPAGDVQAGSGEIPTLGAITWASIP